MHDVDVVLYAEASHEAAVLDPIGEACARRGARVRTSSDFSEPATVGLYACHANRFFDFERGRWQRPPNELSVLALHDLGQDGGSDAGYFFEESWRAVDLGLLPGPVWEDRWQRAVAAGAYGPTFGMEVVGWPKTAHIDADHAGFRSQAAALRERLVGTDNRLVVLLACSWSDRRQLQDALARLDPDRHVLVAKYPRPNAPPEDSPWLRRLTEADDEARRARELAAATPGVVVAGEDDDIMALVAAADVVLSNGSNVLYEGVLAETPGISIRQWLHPAGSTGDMAIAPRLDLPGVLNGDLDQLEGLLTAVLADVWQPLLRASPAGLVAESCRGRAPEAAAEAIEHALGLARALGDDERRRLTEQLNADVAVAEVAPDPLEEQLARAQEQLVVYEAELARLRDALRTADERNARADAQLRRYEQDLAALRGGV